MSQTLTIELNEATFAAISRAAEQAGNSPANIAASALESQFQNDSSTRLATGRLEDLFGCVSLPWPAGIDNKQIDAELAREYGDSHESA